MMLRIFPFLNICHSVLFYLVPKAKKKKSLGQKQNKVMQGIVLYLC